MEKGQRSHFTGSIGFVLAAAGSAVGLGNIWRFPYLAAKGGGVFIVCYIALALTFGFTLLISEIAIGRKTGQSALTAYGKLKAKWKWVGILACIIPSLILPYYCVIGGWVLKYFSLYATGSAAAAVQTGYFSNFIKQFAEPVIWLAVFLLLTSWVVYKGVNKGIEKYSKMIMPVLLVLIICIAAYCLTLKYTDESGITRSGLEGLRVYLVPNFEGMTLRGFVTILSDAMGQLFYSISVAMGIMVTFGSYVKKETDIQKSVNQIELFDSIVAILAGLMIVPAVYTFMGAEGMNQGPGLMFVSLPKVFAQMGPIGNVVGIMFFVMVLFAALTSSVSILETIVSSVMDQFGADRKKATLFVFVPVFAVAVVVCLGYNLFYFELTLPNGSVAQILDILDYISNYVLMPVVAIATCILIGWILKPDVVIDHVAPDGKSFHRRKMYAVMIRFIAPVMLFFLLLQAVGVIRL